MRSAEHDRGLCLNTGEEHQDYHQPRSRGEVGDKTEWLQLKLIGAGQSEACVMVFVRVFANILCCAMSCWLAGEIILIAIMDSANIIMNYLIIKVTFTETLQRPNHRYLQIPWLLISECPMRVRGAQQQPQAPMVSPPHTRSDAIESNEGALSAHNLPPHPWAPPPCAMCEHPTYWILTTPVSSPGSSAAVSTTLSSEQCRTWRCSFHNVLVVHISGL